VIPWEDIARAPTPDGTVLSLHRRGTEWVIRADGRDLMSNRMHGSEEEMARRVRLSATPGGRLLVGGLGMGYTLRAALDALPPGCRCTVAELSEAVLAWNRGPLGDLAGRPLDDPRVDVVLGDITRVLWSGEGVWDVVLLDVDNGPGAFTQVANGGLYDMAGLQRTRRALRRGGALAVWSAFEEPQFETRLRKAGFAVEVHRVRARGSAGGPRHLIYVGRLGRIEQRRETAGSRGDALSSAGGGRRGSGGRSPRRG
jgi:spermidine synthase